MADTRTARWWPIILVLVAHLGAASSAHAQGEAAAPAPEPAAQPTVPTQAGALPAERDEVNGTCLTPRQAWLQHLWWTRKDADRAAACFDISDLGDPAGEAPVLARRLLEHLDSNGLRINTEGAPTDPNYIDPGSGRHIYADPIAPGFVVAKQPDGRWLFTVDSLHRIPEPGFVKRLAERLPMWFHNLALGIEFWKYLGVVILIFLALLVRRIVVFFIRTYLRSLVGRSKMRYLDAAVAKADRPIGGLIMAGIFYLGFPALLFPLRFSQIALVATKALAAFSLVWFAYRLIDVFASWMDAKADRTETKLDDQLVPLIAKTLKVFVSVVGGIFVLQNLSVDVGSLLAGVGLGGLAFALAAKDTVANFFGSVMIFIDKPFQIGDWVQISGVEGTVEEVGFRTTRVRTFYNSLITLPNSVIVSASVDNFGMRQYRRYSTTLGLTYDTPPEKVQAFCEAVRALIAGMPGMRKDYYMVEFKEFGDCSLNIMLYCFMIAPTWNDEMRTRTVLNLEIMRVANKLGVSFAFPTRTLHVDSLANLGEARPSHSGPQKSDELREVVDGFGPKGAHRLPRGFEISKGYDCGPQWAGGSDGG